MRVILEGQGIVPAKFGRRARPRRGSTEPDTPGSRSKAKIQTFFGRHGSIPKQPRTTVVQVRLDDEATNRLKIRPETGSPEPDYSQVFGTPLTRSW